MFSNKKDTVTCDTEKFYSFDVGFCFLFECCFHKLKLSTFSGDSTTNLDLPDHKDLDDDEPQSPIIQRIDEKESENSEQTFVTPSPSKLPVQHVQVDVNFIFIYLLVSGYYQGFHK